MNRFEQPFILTASNFGSLNYLDLNDKKTSYAGDSHGAKSVVAILNYSASQGKFDTNKHDIYLLGFYLARDQAAADISISGEVGNKWTNLKSLCFELKDAVGLPIPLDTKSHLSIVMP